jgi:hypothetical protein
VYYIWFTVPMHPNTRGIMLIMMLTFLAHLAVS